MKEEEGKNQPTQNRKREEGTEADRQTTGEKRKKEGKKERKKKQSWEKHVNYKSGRTDSAHARAAIAS